MALIGSSVSSSTSTSTTSNTLTLNFLNSLITSTIAAQRQPITTLNSQKDQLNVKKAIYSDLKDKLSTLNSIMDDLKSSSASTVFDNKTANSSDSSKLTATATSIAANGTYSISITDLAKTHRIRSDQQPSTNEALNLDGTFTLNGKSITVGVTDTLQDIVNTINNKEYDEGKGVSASIVNKNLVIEAETTGEDNKITASDTSGTVLASLGVLDGGDIKNTLQDALDASFTINGVSVTRASNTELNDVIDGVTLNLNGETEGTNTITLTVQKDYIAIKAKVGAFVSNLNNIISYLGTKTKTVANPENKTYTRGALTGDTIFTSLKMNLFTKLRTQVTGSVEGDPERLADIGVTIGNGLALSLDTSKLDSLVGSNLDGVVRLFDGVMEQFKSVLDPFITSNSGSNTLDLYSNSVNTKIQNIDKRVQNMETALSKREAALVKQYSAIYIQNIELASQQYSLFGYSTQA
ncbi:MAG: Flagellar hook-associated protein 2 [Candidatus Poribacteria bacterium]|nr:Flagellar hook-associated protein 2 [Candidatus Poribacteria bacterium]